MRTQALGRHAEAEPLLRQALHAVQRGTGPRSAMTAAATADLEACLAALLPRAG